MTFGGQFGYAAESTWGTVATPDHFIEIDTEGLEYGPTWSESEGIHAGQQVKRASRAYITAYEGAGPVGMPFGYNKMGALLKACLGSSAVATQILSTAAYKQVHQLGDMTGKSLTAQVGRPQSDGTVKPFTYPGAKVLSWELSWTQGGLVTFTVTFDTKDEQTGTSLAAATYIAGSGVFTARDTSTFTLGGTASTTSSIVSVASGTPVASLITSFTLRGTNGLANQRRGLGNAGAKSEQLQNALTALSGTFGGEFTSQSEIYDVWKAGTTQPLHIALTGTAIASGGGNNNSLDIVVPAFKFKKAPPHLNGYDLTSLSADFDVYSDDVNNPCQITLVSSDTAI